MTYLAFLTLGGCSKWWWRWSTHSTILFSVVPERAMKSQAWRWGTMLHRPTPPAWGHTGTPCSRRLERDPMMETRHLLCCHQIHRQHLIEAAHPRRIYLRNKIVLNVTSGTENASAWNLSAGYLTELHRAWHKKLLEHDSVLTRLACSYTSTSFANRLKYNSSSLNILFSLIVDLRNCFMS